MDGLIGRTGEYHPLHDFDVETVARRFEDMHSSLVFCTVRDPGTPWLGIFTSQQRQVRGVLFMWKRMETVEWKGGLNS
jgi:hypothetical protein